MVVVWVLDIAQVVILELGAAGVATVVDGGITVERWGLGCGMRGWGLDRGAVDRPGRECHRFRGLGGCFEAGEAGVVVVVNDDVVVATDGSGCMKRDWGLGWGAAVRSGSICHHLRGAGGSFGAGEELVVAVVDVDGGCVGIDRGDVAALAGVGELVTMWMEWWHQW